MAVTANHGGWRRVAVGGAGWSGGMQSAGPVMLQQSRRRLGARRAAEKKKKMKWCAPSLVMCKGAKGSCRGLPHGTQALTGRAGLQLAAAGSPGGGTSIFKSLGITFHCATWLAMAGTAVAARAREHAVATAHTAFRHHRSRSSCGWCCSCCTCTCPAVCPRICPPSLSLVLGPATALQTWQHIWQAYLTPLHAAAGRQACVARPKL